MLEVIRTTSEDPRFRQLIAALDADLWRRYGDVQAQYAPHNAIEAIGTAVVALDDGRPVGCGCFKPFGPQTAELKRVFVAAEARGRGIASRLLDELEAWARELGIATMVLETGDKQHEAISLYRRRGYTDIAPFGPYVDLPASLCMARPLAGPAPVTA